MNVVAKQNKSAVGRWLAPILDCLRTTGGSAKPKEVTSWIQREFKLSADVTESVTKTGINRFYNQVAWARQFLVWHGLLDDSARGVWTLTPLGWKTHLSEEAIRQLLAYRNKINRKSGSRIAASTEEAEENAQEPLPLDEAQGQTLLEILKALPPYGFELICQRLLREHGFEDVQVTKQSRDGGIDGYGVLRLSPFVSLRVAFQAKRYKDVVSSPAVGEFRNALLGRAEKGVFITTGRFTKDAEAEAGRDGVVPIELVDGDRLVELFEDKNLGVKPKQIFDIDHAFFDQFRLIKGVAKENGLKSQSRTKKKRTNT